MRFSASLIDSRPTRWLERIALLFLLAGLVFRVAVYFRNFSVWFDEAVVLLNVLTKGYRALLGPLDHAANGPPLFFWIEKLLVDVFGDQTLVWRLPAFIAGVAGLGVFFVATRRILTPPAWLIAIILFACSDRLLWHGAETKPYTIDVFVSICVMTMYLRTRAWQIRHQLLLWTIVGPALMLLSYPAVFVLAGVGLMMTIQIGKPRLSTDLLLYLVFVAVLGGTGLWLATGPIAYQKQGMQASGFTWLELMPNYSNTVKLLWWPVYAWFEVHRYCFAPVGGLLSGFTVLGIVHLWRSGQKALVTFLLAPILGTMAAAILHLYPFGCGRVCLFLTPQLTIFLAVGLQIVIVWFRGWISKLDRRSWRHPAPYAVAWASALLVFLVGQAMYRTIEPWPHFDTRGAASYVLSHRKPDDPVIVNAWDQIYYITIDPNYKRSALARTSGNDSRLWVIVNEYLQGFDPLLTRRDPGNDWKIAEVQHFDKLSVFLLERKAKDDAQVMTDGQPAPFR